MIGEATLLCRSSNLIDISHRRPRRSAAIRAAVAEDPDTFELAMTKNGSAKPESLKEVLPDTYGKQWYGNSQNSDEAAPSSVHGIAALSIAPTRRLL